MKNQNWKNPRNELIELGKELEIKFKNNFKN